MALPDLPIELKTDFDDADLNLYVMIEDRLNELAKGHTDIVGAAATLGQPAQGRNTPYIYDASIVVYMRPNNVSASQKDGDPQAALKGALDAIERQVRKQRGKMKDDRGSMDNFWVASPDDAEDADLT